MTFDAVPDTGRLAGLITAAELTNVGLNESKIDMLIRRGVLTRVARGLYARSSQLKQIRADPKRNAALRVAVAVAISGPESVGSHADAAAVHGLAMLHPA